MSNNQQTTAYTFINYFLSIAEDINVNRMHNNINSHNYQYLLAIFVTILKTLYLNIKRIPKLTNKIEIIIKSLESKNTYGYDEVLKISSCLQVRH